jgi:hypothetical protein
VQPYANSRTFPQVSNWRTILRSAGELEREPRTGSRAADRKPEGVLIKDSGSGAPGAVDRELRDRELSSGIGSSTRVRDSGLDSGAGLWGLCAPGAGPRVRGGGGGTPNQPGAPIGVEAFAIARCYRKLRGGLTDAVG